MKLAELLNVVLNKDNFLTIEDYMDFPKQYLNFIKKRFASCYRFKKRESLSVFSI